MKVFPFVYLTKNLSKKKYFMYAQMWNTLLSIPDNQLNAYDKIVLSVFSILSSATKMHNAMTTDLSDPDSKHQNIYQIPYSSIGEMTGLSEIKIRRILRGSKTSPSLPAKIHKLNKSGFTDIEFYQVNEKGKKISKNISGIPCNYYFKYIKPQNNEEIKISIEEKNSPDKNKTDISQEARKTGKRKKVNNKEISIPEENKNNGFSLSVQEEIQARLDKHKLFDRLKNFFSQKELNRFMDYDLEDISKAIDYFLDKYYEKKTQLEMKGKPVPDKILTIGWLKSCFTDKYYDSEETHTESKLNLISSLKKYDKLFKHFQYEKNSIHGFNIPLKNKNPKYNFTSFNNVGGFDRIFSETIESLTDSQKLNLEILSSEIYELALSYNITDIPKEKEWAIFEIKKIILNKHFNLF